VLLLSVPAAPLRGVAAAAQETVSAKQAATKPHEETRKPYACPAPVGEPLSKPSGGAASPRAPRKEQDGHDPAASLEFCIELPQPPSAVEECVRRILLEIAWTMVPNSEDKGALLARRHLESEELRRVAQTEILGGNIHWEEGMANAEIRLIPHSERETQVRIRARILGKGSTTLRLMRMSPWWPLVSTGALEGDVLAALEARCGSNP
jgi:hypothetical protein